jgi:hypothetical protein
MSDDVFRRQRRGVEPSDAAVSRALKKLLSEGKTADAGHFSM